jgi:para-nitrobenzyl esterase
MTPDVAVRGGTVRGVERDGVWCFAGVPFARTGAGALRWRPPVPVEPWSGVREAGRFGPIAPQSAPVPGLAIPGDPEEQDEDCCNLNIWTPAVDGGRRPVMVWIHGGGFTTGTGAGTLYRADELVGRGDVVVVTFNYRLGALGFLAHPALAGGPGAGLGNAGLLDQLAALEWVRDHIASFGGDPGNVTVFGESAGGMSVSALLAMPRARGLFHRAIVQSGPPYTHTRGRAAEAAGDLFAVLGLDGPGREDLEAVPADDLVAATQTLQNRLPRPGELPLPFLPVVDGVLLPRHPQEAVAAGAAADVPLMIGTTRDELAMFAIGDPRLWEIDQAGLVGWIGRWQSGVDADKAVEVCREVREARGESVTPRAILIALGTDFVFRWPSLKLASAQRVHQDRTFVYLFTQETPAFGGVLGSCHALDIPYVFGGIHRAAVAPFIEGSPDPDGLAGRMQRAWTTFARTGEPSDGTGSRWEPWDPVHRPTMVFGPMGGPVHGPRDEELAVWEAVDPLGGPEISAG